MSGVYQATRRVDTVTVSMDESVASLLVEVLAHIRDDRYPHDPMVRPMNDLRNRLIGAGVREPKLVEAVPYGHPANAVLSLQFKREY